MAVAPLFVASMAALKSRLRLSQADGADQQALIDQAVEDVRLGFYHEGRGLGAARVAAILAIAYVENATTANALLRTLANAVEVKWVRMLLMRRMPVLFMDASSVTIEVWNQEPVTRLGLREIMAEADRLEAEILSDLAALAGDEDEEGGLHVMVFEPSETPDRPGQSIAPTLWRGD